MRFFGARAAVLPVAFLLSVPVVGLPVTAEPAVSEAAAQTPPATTAPTAAAATPEAAAKTTAPDTAAATTASPAANGAEAAKAVTPAATAPAPETTATTTPATTTPTTAATTTPTTPTTPPATTANTTTAPDAAQPSAPAAAAATAPTPATPAVTPATAPVTPQVDPVIEALRSKLTDPSTVSGTLSEYGETLKAFYASRTEPLWIKGGAFTAKANAAMAEIKNADSYGLDASKFELPELASGAAADVQADAEIKLAVAVLKYAHHARGGRIDPVALSNILDMKPPLKDPAVVLTEIAAADAADAYLRGLNPHHPQFEKLRLALDKARGPQFDAPIDEALKIKLPKGKTLKIGQEHDDVALLRKRLKVEVLAGSSERLFDAVLETAVKTYQEENGIKANGQLNAKTRAVLNKEGEPKTADPKRDIDRIVANMERWRWLPEDLGKFYIINNIPEYVSRVMNDGKEELKVKMIVGQSSWPTPVLTSSLLYVIFQPEWGVPDGIKMKELLPRLKRASAQSTGFFDQLFGGSSSSGGARVLAAYKLKPSLNGRPVDANSVDWSKVDIRRFSFVQPAGSENPLGQVKFRFPNRHDVYMHDTPQKGLFNQSFRALSHGCMRIENHRRLAEVLLAEDKGWSPEKVASMYGGGTRDITLDKPVPVYLTYFTARVDDEGKLQTFSDIYGHDERVSAALQGKPVRYKTPEKVDAVASSEDTMDEAPQATDTVKKKSAKTTSKKQKRNTETAGDILSDALSGLIAN
ncbi:MAG: L,D-transpeptidase family protein [Hyphomicrobium sp.]